VLCHVLEPRRLLHQTDHPGLAFRDRQVHMRLTRAVGHLQAGVFVLKAVADYLAARGAIMSFQTAGDIFWMELD